MTVFESDTLSLSSKKLINDFNTLLHFKLLKYKLRYIEKILRLRVTKKFARRHSLAVCTENPRTWVNS